MQWLCLVTFVGCLIFACVTDLLCSQVYNFTWWIAYVSQGLLLWRLIWTNGIAVSDGRGMLVELALFCGVQLLVAGRIYGRADSYAFCACALCGACHGMGMAEYLKQMLWAYLLLFVVQAVRRNISANGNLKKPVPFLPYITISFCGSVILA